jgi:hypothetical protein
MMPGVRIAFGRGVCGSLDEAATREWLVADGLGATPPAPWQECAREGITGC